MDLCLQHDLHIRKYLKSLSFLSISLLVRISLLAFSSPSPCACCVSNWIHVTWEFSPLSWQKSGIVYLGKEWKIPLLFSCNLALCWCLKFNIIQAKMNLKRTSSSVADITTMQCCQISFPLQWKVLHGFAFFPNRNDSCWSTFTIYVSLCCNHWTGNKQTNKQGAICQLHVFINGELLRQTL